MTKSARTALWGVLIAFGLTVGGCNTMRGLGQDTQAAGQAVEEKAERPRTY